MLLIGGRSPNKILYSQASGQIWQTDLVPLYDGHGLLERNEPVPFRHGPCTAAHFVSVMGQLLCAATACTSARSLFPSGMPLHSCPVCKRDGAATDCGSNISGRLSFSDMAPAFCTQAQTLNPGWIGLLSMHCPVEMGRTMHEGLVSREATAVQTLCWMYHGESCPASCCLLAEVHTMRSSPTHSWVFRPIPAWPAA